jgi:hypothetical protein
VGAATINGMPVANGTVVFSCGCSSQAGTVKTDSFGNFTITTTSQAIPPSPHPTYTTVPGRNYLIVAKDTSGAEAWTMAFLGKVPSHNVGLGAGNAVSTDPFTAAAALYIFYASPQTAQSDLAFDQWNFNTIASWADHLRTSPLSSLTPQEQALINDIQSAQASGKTMFPTLSQWYPGTPAQSNSTIKGDLAAVKTQGSADPLLPTPCPGGVGSCTNTPTP